MSLRCLFIIVDLFFAVQSASIVKSRNIPVEVIYEKSNPSHYGIRNLDVKPQLSPVDFLKLKISEDIINSEKKYVDEVSKESQENLYGVRNLDEKIQLSPEELSQVLKFLPNTVENQNSVKPTQLVNENSEEAKLESTNLVSILKKAEEVAYSGINTIRNNIDKASEAIVNAKPTQEAWEKLNQTLEQFFTDQYRTVILKQDKPPENQNNNENSNQNNQNNQGNEFLQNLVTNFQTTVNNWVNNFQQNNNQKPQGPEDEQQAGQGGQNQGGQTQGPWQNFFTFFSNGINQIVNNMNTLNAQNSNSTSGQEDTGTGSNGGSNIFGNVVSSIQQFFGGQSNQGGNPAQASNNQSDTGVQSPSNQGGFFQQAFNQVVGNFRPTTTSKAPVQGDEGTASSTTTQATNIFGSISQAFQNVNFFGTTQAPQGGVGGGSGGSNPIISGAQAVGSQFGQVLGGQGGSGSSGGGGGSNPIASGAEAIGSQFGQLAGGQSGASSAVGNQIGQLVGGQDGNNPLENLQNAISGSTSASSTEKDKVGNAKSEYVTSSPALTENMKQEEKTETVEKIK